MQNNIKTLINKVNDLCEANFDADEFGYAVLEEISFDEDEIIKAQFRYGYDVNDNCYHGNIYIDEIFELHDEECLSYIIFGMIYQFVHEDAYRR